MSAPDTIVLVHGLWMTPRSFEHSVRHYEARGLKVLAPAYPGFEVEVEALRQDPSTIAAMTIERALAHYEQLVRALPSKPVIMGHSFGGALVQLLLDRGLGAAGVAIDSAPTKGVLLLPWSSIRSLFPVLKNPSNRTRAVALTFEQFTYAFANTLPEAAAREAFERYAIAAPGSFVFAGAAANLSSASPLAVDYKKPDRAPLLFISGEKDHTLPPSVNRSNAKLYKSGVIAHKVFAGRGHFICGEPGWEEVADHALAWARAPVAGRLD